MHHPMNILAITLWKKNMPIQFPCPVGWGCRICPSPFEEKLCSFSIPTLLAGAVEYMPTAPLQRGPPSQWGYLLAIGGNL